MTTPTHEAGAPSTPPPALSFMDSLCLPLDEPLLHTTPRAQVSRVPDDCWVLRRSVRLMVKSAFRDPQPEKQAKQVLLNKWTQKL